MKSTNKFSVALSIFMLTILFTGLSSCNKGNSINSLEKQLIGSVWEDNTDTYIDQQLVTQFVTQSTLTFVSGTEYTLVEINFFSEPTVTTTTSGTYVYNPPSITLTSRSYGENYTGTITGNTMEFWALGVFTKK